MVNRAGDKPHHQKQLRGINMSISDAKEVTTEHDYEIRIEIVDGHHKVIANALYAPGDRILRFDGELSDKPSRTSIQLNENEHVNAPAGISTERAIQAHPFIFLNHSCDPSAVQRGDELFAIRAIEPGEEVTFDYQASEYEFAEPFHCRCASPKCDGEEVRGFRYLSPAEQERRRRVLSPHLLAVLDSE
jgi:hypothetical protein